MKDIEDLDIKAEIDQITKRIDAIIQQVEQLDPAKDEKKNNEDQ